MGNHTRLQEIVLGLDIGTNSVGWALLSCEDGQPIGLQSTGVRVFSAGVEGDIEAGRDASRAVKRREARLRRRMLGRRSHRLMKLALLLQEAGLLPPGDLASPEARVKFFSALDQALFSEAVRKSSPHVLPYLLRVRALDERLSSDELGRALYHLAQRRGFLSNRRAAKKGGKSKEEEGEVKKAIGELAEKMSESGARTLGEYLARLNPDEERIRARWTARQMFMDEFEKICAAQAPYHSAVLTDEFKKKVYRAIFYQRPLKNQRNLVGGCELEPSRKRSPIALLAAQRCRLLQKVNDLEVITPDGTRRELTPEERTTLLAALEHEGDRTFNKIRRLLELRGHSFNLETGGEDKMPGNRTASALIKIFGDRWTGFSPEKRDRIVHDVRSIQKDQTLASRGIRAWGLDEEKAKAFGSLGLEDGYSALSLKALQKLLPLMEQGTPYATARKEIYGEQPKPQPVDELPSLSEEKVKRIVDVRNPSVQRALTEVRRVVNAIIRAYGKPATIRIELARDLKKSRKDREAIWKRNRENQKTREGAVKGLLEKARVSNPTGRDKEKWLLADECGWCCPYTGKSISVESLFSGSPQFDIEHIISFDRCLDNSFFNKTLCDVTENRNVKRDRTPWEAYGSNPERWNEIIERVKRFKGSAAHVKLERFQLKDLESIEGFTSRQLNDTRYASRLAMRYLGMLYGTGVEGTDHDGRRRIQAGRGQVTHFLRDEWGLNSILNDGGEKTRTDHRHHAIDAVAVALTEAKTVKMLSDAAKRAPAERRRRFGRITPPWPGFRDQLQQAIDGLVVSHRVSRKVNSQMHDETIYSKPKHDREGRACVHVRKRLEKLSKAEVEEIVDPAVKKLVQDRLGAGEPKKVFANKSDHPRLAARDGRQIPVHKVRIRKYETTIEIGRGARARRVMPGSNHHVEVFEVTNERGHVEWGGVVITTYEAMRRLRAGEPIIRRDHGEGRKFVFSLAGGEIIELDANGTRRLCVVRTITKVKQRGKEYVSLAFVRINDARKKKDIGAAGEWKTSLLEPLRKLNCKKVVVSPPGEVRRAND